METAPAKAVNLRYHSYDVYIGRGSPWGNPFSHLPGTKAEFLVGSREEAIARYREWIQTQLELLRALPTLRGKKLGCYCKPKACHGDVLAELVNQIDSWMIPVKEGDVQ